MPPSGHTGFAERGNLTAVLADLTGIHPTTAVHWTRDAAADWTTYAADLTRTPDHRD